MLNIAHIDPDQYLLDTLQLGRKVYETGFRPKHVISIWRGGTPVGLGVDGAAANDAGHLLAEARQSLLLQRVLGGPSALTAREALEMATLGGAQVLGRDDVGSLAPGMAADFVAFDLNQIGFIGTSADLAASLIFCHPVNVSYSVINGKLVVDQGRLTTIDLPVIMERHNAISRALINRTL